MGGSREHMEGAIGAMFVRQANLNRIMVLNLMSLHTERVKADLQDPERMHEILDDLMFSTGEFTTDDLLAVIKAESFDDSLKKTFEMYLEYLGIREAF